MINVVNGAPSAHGPRLTLADLRGVAQLASDATLGVTGIVEQMHGTILRLPLPLGPMRRTPHAGLARLVYGSIRGTTRLVDWMIGGALDPWVDNTSPRPGGRERDAMLAALNGLIGDHLEATSNPLALPMALRYNADEFPRPGSEPRRWLILAHGLCMNDHQWRRRGHDHGAALARDLGLVPVYLSYNTGLGVAENGARLSRQLDSFFATHGSSSDELVMLGYSMGGLVLRNAVAVARSNGEAWVERLSRLVFLGTPHTGAPLAVGGHVVDRALALSPYTTAFARLGAARSRGLRDLRQGLGADLDDLPPDLSMYALAGSLGETPSRFGDRGLGDGLVSVNSALAEPGDRAGVTAIQPDRRWVARGTGHLDLLNDAGVYKKLAAWLA